MWLAAHLLLPNPYSGTAGQTRLLSSCYGTTNYDALSRTPLVMDGGGGTVSNSYTQNDVYQTLGPLTSGENSKRRQME